MEVAAALHHTSGQRTSTTTQFSSTAVEPIAPRVVDPLLPIEEFTGPVYDPVHQELLAAGEMPENMVEFPVVQEQVIVQAIPVVVDPLPPVEEFTGPVYNLIHQEQFAAGEMPENLVEFAVVHEQAIVQAIPQVVDSLPPVAEFTGPGFNQVHHEHFAAVPAVTEFFPMSDDEDGELSAGLRPAPLCEPLPQEQVQRHTVEQVVETFVPVQVLDAPVPQMGEEQVVEFFEPVFDVPKISLDMARRRIGDYIRPTQTAEQLVEVPTDLSYSSLLLRTAEQIIHIPVPQDCGGCGGEGFQGLSPGLGSTAYSGAEDLEHWVDEFGRCWTRSLACPSRWFLQASELVWWDEPDEPGKGSVHGYSICDWVQIVALRHRSWRKS